jgi:hypothetical protein
MWQRKGALVVVVLVRRAWESKAQLLAAGAQVEVLPYQRASADRKQQGKSVGDQATLNRREVAGHGLGMGGGWVVTTPITTDRRRGMRGGPGRITSG